MDGWMEETYYFGDNLTSSDVGDEDVVMFKTDLTFWHSKGVHNGFNQTQHKESAATHIGQEEHDANTATKFWPQRSAYHVWVKLRQSKVHFVCWLHCETGVCVCFVFLFPISVEDMDISDVGATNVSFTKDLLLVKIRNKLGLGKGSKE